MNFIQLQELKAKDRRRAWACYVIGFVGFLITGDQLCGVGILAWFILRFDYIARYGSSS
jgi:hypothetical protein